MAKEFISINIHVPRYQKEYCDLSEEKIRDLYINAFDKIYMEGAVKLIKLNILEEQTDKLREEIKKDKERPLVAKETNFLKDSLGTLEGSMEQMNTRFKAFKKGFNRQYHTLEEFINLIKQVNNIR